MNKIKYDTKKYNFIECFQKIFECEDLQNVHRDWNLAREYELLDRVEIDQDTVYHKHFYDNIGNTDYYNIYKKFISEVVSNLFDEEILYQKIPTFRIHQPGNLAVAAYHRDRDYNHSTYEKNFFLPLTDAFGNNTIWAETVEGKGDYQPMEAKLGEFIMWDGPNLEHGNKTNDTRFSRISIDFRILPLSKYVKTDLESTSIQTKMNLNEYWEKVSKI